MIKNKESWKSAEKVRDRDRKLVPVYALEILAYETENFRKSENRASLSGLDIQPYTLNLIAFNWYKVKKISEKDLWEQMHAQKGEETKVFKIYKNILNNISASHKEQFDKSKRSKGGIIFRRRNLNILSA